MRKNIYGNIIVGERKMKNIPKNKLEVIKMVLLMIGFILIISWDYIDVKIPSLTVCKRKNRCIH